MIETQDNPHSFEFSNKIDHRDVVWELTNEKLNIILPRLFTNILNFNVWDLSFEEKLKLFEWLKILKYSNDLWIWFIKVLLFWKKIHIDWHDHVLMNLDFASLKSFLFKLVDTEFYHETLVLDSKLDFLTDMCELRKTVTSKNEVDLLKKTIL